MIIFIDFDDVLFNTKSFKDELALVFDKNQVTKENFDGYYLDYPRRKPDGTLEKYDIGKHIEILDKKFRVDTRELRVDVEKLMDRSSEYLFPDSVEFLKQFSVEQIYIVSFGDTPFQEMKIGNCNIGGFCEKIIITDSLKSHEIGNALLKTDSGREKIFFIEDRIDQIDMVKKTIPEVTTVHVRRPEGRYQDECLGTCDFDVTNLKEAGKIINRAV